MDVPKMTIERTNTNKPFLGKSQRVLRWDRSFTFQGRTLWYNRVPFNNCAERVVEVPLAFDFLAHLPEKERILEIGNVLQYYENELSNTLGLRHRRIIDKFEVSEGVENVDLMELDSSQKFQAIVCISTVEHVGQHCTPDGSFGEQKPTTDLEGPLKAIAKVYDLLEPGGHALITVPFGQLMAGGWYVQFSKDYLALLTAKYGIPTEALSVGFLRCLARERGMQNPRQQWLEVTADEVQYVRYNALLSGARAIAVIKLTRSDAPFTLNLSQPDSLLQYKHPTIARTLFFLSGSVQRLLHL
ncbi:MAG TPA: hypothetical protein VL461_03270 [Dictyobacter sp.]|jgi:hypothetical protein|nr:hypothetical protein [Dictyobacter sp.]